MAGTGSGSAHVGRELELERLGRALERAAEGRGGIVLVRGPSGMGTTRTAREVAGRAERVGTVAVWGQTHVGLSGRPYGAMAEALEALGTGATADALRAHLAGGAPALARLCPRLRDVLPDIAPAAPLDAVDERLRLYDAVVGWLRRAAADRPVLIVLDDWQWADEDSQLLLNHLAGWVDSMPVLVLLTDAIAPGVEPLPAPAGATVVELSGLDEGALAAVLGEMSDRPVAPATVAAIHEVSLGHPLFARELYVHVRESSQASGRSLAAADLPATYDGVVSWRLSRLPLDTRAALNALACFPRGVAAGLLTEVTGMGRARLVDVLERAVASGLVRPADPGREYSLYHDRLRLALIASIPARVLAGVHRRAAEAREAELDEDARAHAAELVDHLVAAAAIEPAAGSDPRAVRHLLVAAEQARAAYAHCRSADLLGHAVAAFGEGRQSDYVDLVARRALANAEAARTGQAEAGIRELVTGQRRHGALTRESWADVVTAIRAIRYGGDVAAAARSARLAHDEGAPRDDLVRRRLVLLGEEWQTTSAGGTTGLSWRADESGAAEALIAGGDETDRADAFLWQRPRSPAESGQLTVALANWHRPAGVLRGLDAASSDLILRLGQFRAGAAMAGRYLASAERFGALRDVVRALLLLARARAALGELSTASEILLAADELVPRLPEPGDLVVDRALAEAALAYYLEADWASLSDRLNALTAATPSPYSQELVAELAIGNARAGREAEVRVALPLLLDAATQVPPLTFGRDAALVGTLTAIWEIGAAEHAHVGQLLLDKSVAVGAGGTHAASPRLARARLLGLAARVAEARDDFARERSRLDGAGMRPLRAMVDHDEALTIAASGTGYDEAGRLLEQAFRQFNGLGMAGWARRVETLQASGFDAARQAGGRLSFTYPADLTRAEVDVVRLLATGHNADDAARELGLDRVAVDELLAAALQKLGAMDVDELPRLARRYGLGGS